MSQKAKRTATNTIKTYLDPDPGRITRSTARSEHDSAPPLGAVKELLTHEFARFEQHSHSFKADICTTIDDAEKRFESKLALIAQKIDRFESWQKEHNSQIEQLDKQVGGVDQKAASLHKAY